LQDAPPYLKVHFLGIDERSVMVEQDGFEHH
jgi:hypothetical protein